MFKINLMPRCEYGCGRYAIKYFKYSKKWCCQNHYKKCPAVITIPWSKGLTKKDHPSLQSISNKLKGKPTWMKGLSTETDPRVKKLGMKLSKTLSGRKKSKQHIENLRKSFTPEKRKRYSKRMLENNPMKDPEIAKKSHSKTSGKNHPFYGKKRPEHSKAMTGDNNPSKRPEVKRKLRKNTIKRIKTSLDKGYQAIPFYNPTACTIIDEYGKQNNYNFQHAENGGEFYIQQLGYWVDGYDEEKNTIIEVDEPHHFDADGNLTDKDIRRQNEIIEYLKCDFIRIKVDTNNNVIEEGVFIKEMSNVISDTMEI